MRVFAVSDLHVDYAQNAQWVEQLSDHDYTRDVLLVAGDVSDKLTHIAACLQVLSRKFRRVAYIPGNHDLWTRSGFQGDSFEKLAQVMDCVRDLGILTTVQNLGPVTIVPLYSWYDFSFGTPSEDLMDAWMDFRVCRWPLGSSAASVSSRFLDMNGGHARDHGGKVITFSHFLPRLDVLPERARPWVQYLYPVLGTKAIDAQVRAAGSSVHVYGHIHIRNNAVIDGVRYINNALGNPKEQRSEHAPVCIFDSETESVA